MPVCPNCGQDNPEGFTFCGVCAAPLAAPQDVLDEERKIVTVLFCDLVGFTASADSEDPEDVRATLRPYHESLRREIERFSGTVEKFIGDAVMAVFGAPVAHEDDAERAVRSALRILEAITELNESRGLDLAVRIGVNTGEAVVALRARPSEGEGIVTGDVVNTASRLQGVAPVGGIVVGETTYRTTSEVFEYHELEPASLKGKAEPVRVWRAVSARSRFGIDLDVGAGTEFIGRDFELSLLKGTYGRTLREASTQLVTIAGEPGVGKSRLLAEFRRFVDDQPDLVFWRQGRCLPYGEGITFWALGEIVKAQAGILESDPVEQAAAKLEAALRSVTEDATEQEWLRARLAPLVGVTEQDAGGAGRDESFAAWRRLLEAIASQRPLILVFEDLHWADEALVEFLDGLVDWSVEVPLLVVCTARPELYEAHPGWGGGKRNSSTISLSPLSQDETARLVHALLSEAVLPAETQALLIERSGGNPLYAEEFVRMLADRGLLERTGATVRLSSNADIPVPDSVQALIAARLDTLTAERKALLQNAAVIGKVFWTGAVATMAGVDEASVMEGLRELARKELVRPARTSSVKDQAEFAFWHGLIRDVAYGQVPRAARASKHEQAARWIEEIAADRLEDLAEILVHHYEQAVELARASKATVSPEAERRLVENLVKAGERAFGLDVSKAVAHYRRALGLLVEGDPLRNRVLSKLAFAYAVEGRMAEGDPLYAEAIAGFEADGDHLAQGDAMANRAYWLWAQGHGPLARETMANAIAVLEAEPPGRELFSAYEQMGALQMLGGRDEAARAWTDKAMAMADRLGIEHTVTRALQIRGICKVHSGDMQGLDDLELAVQRALDQGMSLEAVRGLTNLSAMLDEVDPRRGFDLTEQGIDLAVRRGITGPGQYLRSNHLWYLRTFGRWDELLAEADEVIRWDVAQGGSQIGLFARNHKLWVLAERGRLDEARALAPDVLEDARRTGDLQAIFPAVEAVILLELHSGRPHVALGLAKEQLDVRREGSFAGMEFLNAAMEAVRVAGDLDLGHALLGDRPEPQTPLQENRVLSARATLAEAEGTFDQAIELWTQAAERWGEYPDMFKQGAALLGLGRSLVGSGDLQGAVGPLEQARAIFGDLGARPRLAQTDDLLAGAIEKTS